MAIIPIDGYKQTRPPTLGNVMTSATGRLPSRSRPEWETTPLVIPIQRSEAVFDALSSQTARAILTILVEEPLPASGVAERTDVTIQNAIYHLRRLQDAGLVAVVDTWWSEKGHQMSVYAGKCDPLVLTFSESAIRPQSAERNASECSAPSEE